MTIAYIRTYSNKQQTESQKNAIEQFAKAKKIEIDKWLKDAKNSSKEKNRLEDVIKNLQEGDILIVADVTRLSRKLHLGLFLRLKANLFLPVRKKH